MINPLLHFFHKDWAGIIVKINDVILTAGNSRARVKLSPPVF